ncbi:ABC transporter ATP-binding protein [Limnoglobus roseus]|uniref:Teichoic acid ABC transporter ATPase n=1 Tax=Limnoglobus roseus TaxID=2598579 RepID=A0A5C1AGN1_9BACT|nr:ABC transporter ATP-binding protein [Limnoglobus roseus]QEL16108.1 teichoic acid ABC transporter ATPase [Limnoglobus roseus]
MAKIELKNLSLTFALRKATRISLKEFLLNGMFLKSRNPLIRVPALVDLNLSATDGDRIGVIGHNGAGKSTLLKTLAGIYPPSSGQLTVEGKICSLFDISLGFESDATGRENIRYRAFLQGETPRTLRAKQQEIEEFSDLGEFLDTPVRYYSAGMLVRLAFSVATAVEPEVLLIDEVLSVGDLAFQIKAKERMKQMMANARVMVMVSHDLNSIGGMCDRVLWMEQGRVRMAGPADKVVRAYQDSVKPQKSAGGAAAA